MPARPRRARLPRRWWIGLAAAIAAIVAAFWAFGPTPATSTRDEPPPPVAAKPARRPGVRPGDFLYAVTTTEGLFLKVDPNTGRGVEIGKAGSAALEAITFDASGRIVGALWDGKPRLFRVNVSTGQAIPYAEIKGDAEEYKVVEGLATIDGVVYGSASAADSYCGDCSNHLVRIDAATGRATEVGQFGPQFLNIEALAYSPKYGLIGADIGTLVPPDFREFHTRPALARIDPETGRASKIGDLPPTSVRLVKNAANAFLSPEGPFVCGLDFAPDGTLYGATLPTHFGGESFLLTINPRTAAVTQVGPIGFSHVDGLLYVSPFGLEPASKPERPDPKP